MIFIIQQILPEYRYQVLKYLPEKSFRILYSNVSKEGTLTSVTPKENMFIDTPIVRVGEKYLQNPIGAIHSLRPKTIIFTPELRNFTFWLLLLLKPFYGYKLVSWTHGINNKDFVTGKISFTSRFRFMMMNLSDLVITYSKERAKFLREIISKKIITANNTLDTHTLDEVYNKLSEQSAELVKEELKWEKGSVNFVYIGRLIAEKEIEKNIELFKELSLKLNKPCFFHIIGDGPERKRLDTETNRKVHNILFHGKIVDPQIIGKLLYASDLHLHLGYNGLAVVHSLCFELPIITQKPNKDGPFHSPEFEYLNDKNSIVRDYDQILDCVVGILGNGKVLNELKKESRNTYLEDCRINHFLNTFIKLTGELN